MAASGIKVIAPASVSNLACGFDTLGVALDLPCDEIIGRLVDQPGIHITELTGRKKDISVDPANNIAAIAAQALLDHLGESGRGLEFRIHKQIQGGSGLGSSASSAVAAVLLVNELLHRPLEKRDLIPFALQGEAHASGIRHGDNVIPAMLGGLMLIRDIQTLDYHRIYTPPGLFFAILLPDFLLQTQAARAILRQEVLLADAVRQAANLGAFVIGMHTGDLALIGRSMQDHLVEKQRRHLIPHYDQLKELAENNGALACNISGAGPAVFSLCTERTQAAELAIAMETIYHQHKIPARSFSCGINTEGARLY